MMYCIYDVCHAGSSGRCLIELASYLAQHCEGVVEAVEADVAGRSNHLVVVVLWVQYHSLPTQDDGASG